MSWKDTTEQAGAAQTNPVAAVDVQQVEVGLEVEVEVVYSPSAY
jgi:hypothetical protein